MIKTGLDLVEIKEIERQIQITNGAILKKVFHDEEIVKLSIESIAARFAVKEALIKAGVIKVGEWLKVKIKNDDDGRPYVLIEKGEDWVRLENVDISMSHTETMAIGIAVISK